MRIRGEWFVSELVYGDDISTIDPPPQPQPQPQPQR
jgi:hypothetical protein